MEEKELVDSGLISLTENGVVRIHRDLVFGRVADQSLCVREGDITRCRSISLIICNDLNFSMLENTDAGIRGAQVNSNSWSFRHVLLL